MNTLKKFVAIQEPAQADLQPSRQAEPVQRAVDGSSAMQHRSHCPGCLSSSLSLMYKESYSGASVQNYLKRHYENRASKTADSHVYALACCNDCGLTFQQNVPGDAFLGEIYNQWVPGTELERAHRNYSLEEYRYLAEQVQFIIQHFGLAPGELDALDFGFGWAHWSRWDRVWR